MDSDLHTRLAAAIEHEAFTTVDYAMDDLARLYTGSQT